MSNIDLYKRELDKIKADSELKEKIKNIPKPAKRTKETLIGVAACVAALIIITPIVGINFGKMGSKHAEKNYFAYDSDEQINLEADIIENAKNYSIQSSYSFGHYPQSLVTDELLLQKLTELYAGNSFSPLKQHTNIKYFDTEFEGRQFRAILPENETEIYWFEFEPVKWTYDYDNKITSIYCIDFYNMVTESSAKEFVELAFYEDEKSRIKEVLELSQSNDEAEITDYAEFIKNSETDRPIIPAAELTE